MVLILLILLEISPPKLKNGFYGLLLILLPLLSNILQILLFLDIKLEDYFLSSVKNIKLSFKKLLLLLS